MVFFLIVSFVISYPVGGCAIILIERGFDKKKDALKKSRQTESEPPDTSYHVNFYFAGILFILIIFVELYLFKLFF